MVKLNTQTGNLQKKFLNNKDKKGEIVSTKMLKILQVFCALVVPYVISCSSLYILLVIHLQYHSDLDKHENIFCICIKTKS